MRAAVVALLLSGCYLSSTRDREGGVDGGLRDAQAEAGSCEVIAGYRTCDPLCDERCPRPSGCHAWLPVCVESSGDEVLGDNACALGEGRTKYCRHGFCAPRPGREPYGAASCISEELCHALSTPGSPLCVYSDMTPLIDGPPDIDACPGPPGGGPGGFCGGPCGECPPPFRASEWPESAFNGCTGQSESRPIGVCTTGINTSDCSREDGVIDRECRIPGTPWPESAVCGCMFFRVEGEEQEVGWRVFEDSCRAYRDLFPGQVECYRTDIWEPL
ncbi:Hypothetical protein I5071_56430 [Sandaracinus amylolyticus]|nr:Hypothetical protein I5071_56430 [Sandaracinus amylolyticus]